ncbi:hypothetical protein R2223_003459 [Cronobacter sakazakii]|uniref:hypothetical protein n=1 Tax=Cronobacter sakazakii TaxID=28141 RepID=UPI00293823E0|nr:hypothetical protein [Cronobacter sakazakii]EKS1073424.1 hypothetical protein [Cronobacter sakazakii]EKS1087102.1 hypothetical protein [Cronobacter sakazakii]ELQ5973778.1 hypothetical protein [Cronobacter sakazakii]ELQ6034798.1 hypothetical protein [Cronobacter sakazakii]ELQ6043513.1 hypothetical protein [Cronobacter sakazakii]
MKAKKTLDTVPVMALQDIAAHLPVHEFPVRLSSRVQCAALAAEALWLFAQRTGLSQEGETLDTLLTDFLADVMHLCSHVKIKSDVLNEIAKLMAIAEMHYESDDYSD